MTTLTALLDPFLSLIYPPRCLVCRALGHGGCLCAGCAAQITPVASPICPRCGQSLAASDACSHCHRQIPSFTRARAFGAYDGVLRTAIHHFKYRDRPQLAVPLGLLLADSARTHAPDLNDLRFDALLPVPMHPIRKRLRGYNQSERLAQVVCQHLEIPLLPNALRRTHNTRPQVGLTGDARRGNLRGVFTVPQSDLVAGKTLLLIDDVTTTGSSLSECAATLTAAGAKAVYALTLAAG